MKTKLIEALKKTVDDLVNNRKEYGWIAVQSCNCGLLAQNIHNVEPEKIKELYLKDYILNDNSWGDRCQKTNAPMLAVFTKMFEAGMTADDFIELENLSNPEIQKEAGFSGYTSCNSEDNVIKYMSAWIRILEREQPAKTETPKWEEQKPTPVKFLKVSEMVENQVIHFEN